MPEFNGPDLIITLDDPTLGVLNISVEADLYSAWKEWVLGNYTFNTETDVDGGAETITIIDHSLHTGQDVIYDISGPENIGLVDGTTYYVRRITRNTFELYDTKVNSEGSPATTGRLDLTASGVGNGENHLLDADNSKFINAFRTIGGDPLTPGVEAGPYFFLQNQDINGGDGWRIISTDEDQTINYQGNLVGESSSKALILVTPGRSVLHLGLQPVTQRVDEILELGQTAEYDGGVWIDTINGSSGTVYPFGTPQSPVNNLADATTIATNLSFELFYLRGSIILASAYTKWNFVGVGTDVADIIALAGQDVSGSVFESVSVSGDLPVLTEDVDFQKCRVGNVTDFQGTMTACGLENTITLAAGQTNIVNCYSAAPGLQVVEFDFQATNQIDLFVRGMIGVFTITNSTNGSSLANIDLISGQVTIDSTFTAGAISIRGVGTYVNSSTSSVNDKGLIDSEDMLIIKQMVAGNVTISLDDLTITVLDEDDVTTLAVFSVSADGRIRTRTT